MEFSSFAASFLFGLLFIVLGVLLIVAWRFTASVVTALELNRNGEGESVAPASDEAADGPRGPSRQFLEFIFYLIFVATFCVTMVANRKQGTFTTVAGLEDRLIHQELRFNVRFSNLGKREEVTEWLEAVVLPFVYPEESAFGTGEELGAGGRRYLGDGVSYRVGPLRLRTVRVKGKKSRLTKYLGGDDARLVGEGLPGYSSPFSCDYGRSNEDTSDFVYDGGTEAPLRVEYKSEENAPALYSPFSRLTYCGGGQAFQFSGAANATAELAALKESGFLLNPDVRALVVEFVSYNVNADLFTLFRALVEVFPSGAVVPTHDVTTVPLATMARALEDWRNAMDSERAYLVIELVLYCQIYILAAVNLYQVWTKRLLYFASLWRCSSAACVVTTLVVSVFRLGNAR